MQYLAVVRCSSDDIPIGLYPTLAEAVGAVRYTHVPQTASTRWQVFSASTRRDSLSGLSTCSTATRCTPYRTTTTYLYRVLSKLHASKFNPRSR
jgi:hypothetical protein